jgi:formate hydrogenlyase subunit 3/multisubunit Na+/H+ antiporter MnhD subunit
MTAFGVAAAGLVGVPLVAGFLSEFYLLVGAAASPLPIPVLALLLPGLLKLLYFWPVVYVAFHGQPDGSTPSIRHPFLPTEESPPASVTATDSDGDAGVPATDGGGRGGFG